MNTTRHHGNISDTQGLEKGAYQKSVETAALMKKENCDVDFIGRMTGLSIEEIRNL